LNDTEWVLVKTQTKELLEVRLVELFKRDYALAMVMPTKKRHFGKWIEHWMCEKYGHINKWTQFDKYVMPLPKETFGYIGQPKVFNTLDLRYRFPWRNMVIICKMCWNNWCMWFETTLRKL
jgi:hypothetical protein